VLVAAEEPRSRVGKGLARNFWVLFWGGGADGIWDSLKNGRFITSYNICHVKSKPEKNP
jgi:hypothetical protein